MRFKFFRKPVDEDDALLWRVSWLTAIAAVLSGVGAGAAMYFSGAVLVAAGAAFALSATGVGLIVLVVVAAIAFVGGLLWSRQHQAKKTFSACTEMPQQPRFPPDVVNMLRLKKQQDDLAIPLKILLSCVQGFNHPIPVMTHSVVLTADHVDHQYDVKRTEDGQGLVFCLRSNKSRDESTCERPQYVRIIEYPNILKHVDMGFNFDESISDSDNDLAGPASPAPHS